MIYFAADIRDFITPRELKKKLGVNPGGHVQKAVDKAVIRVCGPYVPKDEGILEGSASKATKIGSGEVVYDTPGARYLYYGEVYGPNIPITENGEIVGYWSPPKKHGTGEKLKYSTEKNPQAGSHWLDRAMADHKDEVLEDAQNAADRGSDS